VHQLREARDEKRLLKLQNQRQACQLLIVDSCGVGSYVESLGFAFSIARLPAASASSDST
jgi:hypothetical protein